jgi:hypothetical protein
MRFAHVPGAWLESIKEATALTLEEAIVAPHRLQALALTHVCLANAQLVVPGKRLLWRAACQRLHPPGCLTRHGIQMGPCSLSLVGNATL